MPPRGASSPNAVDGGVSVFGGAGGRSSFGNAPPVSFGRGSGSTGVVPLHASPGGGARPYLRAVPSSGSPPVSSRSITSGSGARGGTQWKPQVIQGGSNAPRLPRTADVARGRPRGLEAQRKPPTAQPQNTNRTRPRSSPQDRPQGKRTTDRFQKPRRILPNPGDRVGSPGSKPNSPPQQKRPPQPSPKNPIGKKGQLYIVKFQFTQWGMGFFGLYEYTRTETAANIPGKISDIKAYNDGVNSLITVSTSEGDRGVAYAISRSGYFWKDPIILSIKPQDRIDRGIDLAPSEMPPLPDGQLWLPSTGTPQQLIPGNPPQRNPLPEPQRRGEPRSQPLPKNRPTTKPQPSSTPSPHPNTQPDFSPYPSSPPSFNPSPSPTPEPSPNPDRNTRTRPKPSTPTRRQPLPRSNPTPNRSPQLQRRPSSTPETQFPSPEPVPNPAPVPDPPCPPHCVRPMVCRYQPQNDSLLQTILDLLSQLQGGGGELEIVQVTVPIVGFTTEGVPIPTTMQVPAIAGTEDQIITVFAELADLKLRQISDKTEVKRIYQILGGDSWVNEETQEIELSITPEAKVKKAVEDTKIATEEPESAIVAKNLIDLIAALQTPTYGRLGLNELPGSVPETLLAYTDGTQVNVNHWIGFFEWFIKQFDALVGKFPIEIEIEDIDPTTKGNQTKKVELANLSEAFAEMYGLNITSATNSDISINFFMRLVAEVIATKNAALIAQDYAKANASFMGYKGNQVKREIEYAFNPEKLDSLEELLQETKGNIIGWEEQDKESIVGYLMELKFAAGIIKSVFFRGKDQLDLIKREAESLIKGQESSDNQKWQAFLQLINTVDSQFNQGDNPQPKIKD